jgi:hypothetical protein
MQGLFFLGSKTKERTLIIIFLWEKTTNFYCQFSYSLHVLNSRGVHAMNYYCNNSQSITTKKIENRPCKNELLRLYNRPCKDE